MKKYCSLLIVILHVLWGQSSVSCGQEPFADVDLKDMEITMKADNEHCYGARCPVYFISIKGDGTVTYEGLSNVLTTGRRSYKLSEAKVRRLVQEFYRINFFSLKDTYNDYSQDHSAGVSTSIRIGDKTKSVYDFLGAPNDLVKLERRILQISGAYHLIKRD